MRKLKWRAWYAALAWYSERRGASFRCMNWGYDDGRELVGAEAGDERLSLQLYAHLVEGVPLEGRDLVDVSSGRGGGLTWLARTTRPGSALGFDFTAENVALASAFAKGEPSPPTFRVGDAEALPLGDASVDVILSVEASHCYGSMERFVRESARVVRSGGHLLWTDFATPEGLARFDALARTGWAVDAAEDITAHVLRASRADRPRRRALIERSAPRALHRLLHRFAASDDRSETVRMFERGDYVYALRRLRRAAR